MAWIFGMGMTFGLDLGPNAEKSETAHHSYFGTMH